MADELKVPTREEVAALPRWARVAFAARCARRVLPLFGHSKKNVPAEHVEAVGQAVDFAETVAAHASRAAWHTTIPEAAARAASSVTGTDIDAADAAAWAGWTVGSATRTAENAEDTEQATAYAVRAIVKTFPNAVTTIRQDFDTLRSLASREGWTDDTPVPPSAFGPLWPDGPPEGWPVDEPITGQASVILGDATLAARATLTHPIRVIFDRGAYSPADMAAILAKVNELYALLADEDDELVVDEVQEYDPVAARVPCGEE